MKNKNLDRLKHLKTKILTQRIKPKQPTKHELLRKRLKIRTTPNPPDLVLNWNIFNNLKIEFDSPLPVQTQTIPYILNEENVIVHSKTGSGKTLSYVLPYTKLVRKGKLVVISPTKELAVQICAVFRSLLVDASLVTGGYDVEKEQQNAAVLVCTLGKLRDSIEAGCFALGEYRYMVVDEYDKIMCDGSCADFEWIRSKIKPFATQLFSATKIKTEFNFHKVCVGEVGRLNEKIELKFKMVENKKELLRRMIGGYETHFNGDKEIKNKKVGVSVYYGEAKRLKDSLIYCGETKNNESGISIDHGRINGLINYGESKNLEDSSIYCGEKEKMVLIFCNKTNTVDLIEKEFTSTVGLHGKKSCEERKKIMNSAVNGKIRFLVCTDVAARGLDLQNVDFVINYDFPPSIETFVHRAGRTGRIRNGVCFSIFDFNDVGSFYKIEKFLKESKMECPDFISELGKSILD